MKALIGFAALLLATSAFAQTAPPKVGNKSLVQVKPQAPMGCKLVGTVKGIKLWAGECLAASEFRGGAAAVTAPASLPAQATGPVPPGQEQ
jgi:hypothetical protein